MSDEKKEGRSLYGDTVHLTPVAININSIFFNINAPRTQLAWGTAMAAPAITPIVVAPAPVVSPVRRTCCCRPFKR